MDAVFYYACLTTLAAALFALGWLGGQRREADYWASHASRGPVRWRQADYVVFTVSAFAHCFDVRPNLGPADPPCGDCGHLLTRHCGGPEGLCLECRCPGWGPAGDAGCCCEEKAVPYRSVNEG
jgi:hypothetical protein